MKKNYTNRQLTEMQEVWNTMQRIREPQEIKIRLLKEEINKLKVKLRESNIKNEREKSEIRAHRYTLNKILELGPNESTIIAIRELAPNGEEICKK